MSRRICGRREKRGNIVFIARSIKRTENPISTENRFNVGRFLRHLEPMSLIWPLLMVKILGATESKPYGTVTLAMWLCVNRAAARIFGTT